MKKKSLSELSGQHQLSRAQMKTIAAGKYPQPRDCASECGVSCYNQGGSCFCTDSSIPCI